MVHIQCSLRTVYQYRVSFNPILFLRVIPCLQKVSIYLQAAEGMGVKMARKELITKDKILETAFVLAREEGIENVTARKLATQIGCSTQPIFRVYANMNELYTEIYLKATDSFGNYYENYKSEVDVPFIHLGLAYINYAKDEGNLFYLLFQSEQRGERGLFELLMVNQERLARKLAERRRQAAKIQAGCL